MYVCLRRLGREQLIRLDDLKCCSLIYTLKLLYNINHLFVIPECLCRESSDLGVLRGTGSPTQTFGDDVNEYCCFHVSELTNQFSYIYFSIKVNTFRKLWGSSTLSPPFSKMGVFTPPL